MNHFFLSLAQATDGATSAGAAPAGGFGLMQFLPFIIIIAIFYFLMIRPQQRREKERKQMIEELCAGKRVLFAGGLIGTITEAKKSTFMVQVAPNTHLEIARGAVLRVIADGETPSLDEQR